MRNAYKLSFLALVVHRYLHICKAYPLSFMRVSPLRHPLAVLRNILGLNQKEMGDIASCSSHTIQAVELKNLELSEDLALRINAATGISVGWLLAGDPSAPPMTDDSPAVPFTKETFELRASGRMSFHAHPLMHAYVLYSQLATLDGIYVSATRGGKWSLMNYRVEKFIAGMKADFGCDEVAVLNHTASKTIAAKIVAESNQGPIVDALMSREAAKPVPSLVRWSGGYKRTVAIEIPIHDDLGSTPEAAPAKEATKAPPRKKAKVVKTS
jgi:DNA-binding XRE family transcriptional regulator